MRDGGRHQMQVTGMLYGARMLRFVGYPTTEVLDPGASEEEIRALIERAGMVFIKPVFKGGVCKKGKAGLVGRATDLRTALKEKERLFFVEHRVGNTVAKANGVTFEAGVPAEHEVYFSISDSTHFRAPTMTLTHHGGMDIEELDKNLVANVPFDPLTGLKAFVVANALSELDAPKEIISPLVQQLPKLWELFHDFGMTTLELNPIRMRPDRQGRLTPVACDFKCGFDRDDPRWPTPLYGVIGRGGPNLVRGMSVMRDTMEALGLPYRIFGFDSDMSEVVDYARKVNDWMKAGGRAQLAIRLKLAPLAAAD